MNAPLKSVDAIAATEASARIELAAFYRLVEHLGWGEGIYNHIALRVPGSPDEFLIKLHALTYEEVTASNLVKVNSHDDLDERAGVNRVGFCTHAPVMRARPDVDCTIHLHTVPIMAIAAHPKGLRMLHQHSVRFYDDIAYQDYEGFAESSEAQERLVRDLGSKRVLIMHNHGVLITGKSVEDTFTSTLRFMFACEIQLKLEACGQGGLDMSTEACRAAVEQFKRHDHGRGTADWPAWLRRLNRIDTSYQN